MASLDFILSEDKELTGKNGVEKSSEGQNPRAKACKPRNEEHTESSGGEKLQQETR
jgi:hypothetical protein